MRILYIDDHQLVREALTYYLKSSDENIEVVEAGSLIDVVGRAQAAEFDLILLDYRLPGLSGDRAVAAACQRFPDTPVIVLSGAITRDEAQSAIRSGATGVISKDIEGSRLMHAIGDILKGDIQISGLFGLAQPGPGESPQDDWSSVAVSKRERQVGELLLGGLSNKEIANTLQIAEITVRLHLSRLYQKLQARNRADAVRIILTLLRKPAEEPAPR
jgi:two-component system, NarL family, nitrate/nitrite response regulator NarL